MYTERTFDHLDALLLETLVPIALLAGAELWALVQSMRNPDTKKPHVLSVWLSVLFLILPVISRRVCQSFRWVAV